MTPVRTGHDAAGEAARLAALQQLGMLDSAPEPLFDDLVALAADICNVPIALISLVDAHRQWFKARCGLETPQTPREHAFCAHAILTPALLEIPDALLDARFSANPLVLGPPGIRFYAGAPLIGVGGHRYGSLCVIDTQPRRLEERQKTALVRLARQVVVHLETRRLQIEARTNERTLGHLLEAMPDGVVSCDANGILKEFNQLARLWHGVDPRALPPDQWAGHFDLFEPDGISPLALEHIPLLRAWNGEHVRDAEIIIKARGQAPRTVLCNGDRLVSSEGESLGAVAIMRDVTQLRAASALAQEHGRSLATIIEGTRAGTWEWNVKTGEVRFNERWAEILGYRLAELAPVTIGVWRSLCHPDDLVVSGDLLERHFEGESAEYDCVSRMRHKDGRWVWVHDRGRVSEWDSNGEPVRMAGSHLDVTAAKEAELATADAQRRLQAMVDASLDVAIITTDTDGLITVFNPGAEKLLGYASNEVTGRCTPELFHLASEVESRSAILSEVLGRPVSGFEVFVAEAGSGRSETRRWTYVQKSGAYRQVRLSTSALRDSEGVLTGYLGMATDVTDQVLAQEAARLAAERFSGAFAAAAQGMALVSLEGRWMEVNDALCGMFGYDRDALLSSDFQSLTHPDDLASDMNLITELIAGTRTSYHLPKRYFTQSGQTLWARLSVSLVRDVRGRPLHFVSQIQDVSEQHVAEERLRHSEERLRVTLHSIGDAVLTADPAGLVTYVNPMAESLLSRSSADVVGQSLQAVFKVVREDSDEPGPNPFQSVLDGAVPAQTTDHMDLLRHDGTRLAITTSAAGIRSPDGTADGLVLVFRDVSEARALAIEVSHQASHDALTDLGNRREFERQLASTLHDGAGARQENVLLFIDLDGFKEVNDSCGHLAGDALLQDVGRVLRCTARNNDVVARLGGDEFAVILRGCAVDNGRRVAEQLREAIEQIRCQWQGELLRIGASIGLASFRGGAPMAEVLSAADAACYEAKENGKNRVVVSAAVSV